MPDVMLEKALAEATLIRAQLAVLQPDVVVEGGADGADSIARKWALLNNVSVVTIPAQWTLYGKSAGPRRNIEMLELYPKAVVLAFPRGGGGTEHCVREAKKRGMVTYEF